MVSASLIEEKLSEILTNTHLGEAARYAVLGGGKRIRPRLVMAAADLYGAPVEHSLFPACALELIHSYSLIHDDLPCMDNDDFRRGKPSLHKVYGEAHALLVGDFLLTLAFELLASSPYLTPLQRLQLVKTLAFRAGGDGMIGGQALDLAEHPNTEEIHRKKTAALFIAACEFGGIIGDHSDLDFLREFGENLGLAFQLLDDLVDGDISPESAEPLTQVLLSKFDTFPDNSLKKLANQIVEPLKNYIEYDKTVV
jgi:geranylgeranyl diphosphate synthase type II